MRKKGCKGTEGGIKQGGTDTKALENDGDEDWNGEGCCNEDERSCKTNGQAGDDGLDGSRSWSALFRRRRAFSRVGVEG